MLCQTFGEILNFHPHLHCLVNDGCFGQPIPAPLGPVNQKGL
ncbi:MAG: transposase [Nitrospinae bacterium]|nr:transposase [Nitrospinota bacterium]